jgi:hypothetical protein
MICGIEVAAMIVMNRATTSSSTSVYPQDERDPGRGRLACPRPVFLHARERRAPTSEPRP